MMNTIPNPSRDERQRLARIILDAWHEGNLAWDDAGAMERHRAKLTADAVMSAAIPVTGWVSPALDRAYQEVDRLRRDLAQPSESGIDEALRRALDAIETADTEIGSVSRC